MEIIQNPKALPVSAQLPWAKTAAFLAALWMIALAATAEGFPSPLIPGNLAIFLFFAGLVVAIVASIRYLAFIELPIITLIPLLYVFEFDEITTVEKTPFILFCTLILSLGLIAYHYLAQTRSLKVALPVLLAAAILAFLAGIVATLNFWEYTDSLGIGMCFLDYTSCPPLPADHPAWWRFLIGI